MIGNNSVLDIQNKLVKAQADAFPQEHLVKSAKLMLDVFTADVSANEALRGGEQGANTNLNDKAIGAAVLKLAGSAGMSLPPVP